MTSYGAPLFASHSFLSSLKQKSSRLENGSNGVFNVGIGHKERLPSVKCTSVIKIAEPETVARRSSASYTDCVWDYDYIESSMQNNFIGEEYKMQVEEMKQQVLVLLGSISDHAELLELVNDLQRLGVAYHFEKDINIILKRIYYKISVFDDNWGDADLHTTALAFRLFRQRGYTVSEDVFKSFLDESGKFKSSLCSDIKGLASLYEASYLATEGEAIMEEAYAFSAANLSKVNKDGSYLDVLSARTLDMPLYWRTTRCEARWFVEQAYGIKPNMFPLVLQFAKLDYNVVQAMYLEELRKLARWWTKLGLDKDLGFARDCLVVSYLWGIMGSPDPQYASSRKALTESIAIVSVADDVYDIYSTLGEAELFTDAFKRWDIDAMKKLPHYMKICYLACFNCANEMAYDVLIEKGSDASPYLTKQWEVLSSAYMKEARWFHSGYKPTLDEYINNAWVSVAIPLCFMHGHVFDTKPVGEKELVYLESLPEIMKWACTVFRFSDDLGTSSDEMARGDTLKAIQCYMNDTGASEEAAREHIAVLVKVGWRKLNKCVMEERILSKEGVEMLLNLVRAAHCFYQHGDGHGIQDRETKDLMSQLLFEPIPM